MTDLEYYQQIWCPSDDEIADFQQRKLEGSDREKVVGSHILYCGPCQWTLKEMYETRCYPLTAEEEASEEYDMAPITPTPTLRDAIAKFVAAQKRAKARPVIPLEQVLKGTGLAVGQIWRTRNEEMLVLTEDEPRDVIDWGSVPHLVVITGLDEHSPIEGYTIIKVAPRSVEGKILAAEGDLIIEAKDDPLEVESIIEVWAEQPMLAENLETLLGVLPAQSLAKKLQAALKEAHARDSKPPLLGQTLVDGSYRDPIIRHRAHEWASTKYLRGPVETIVYSVPITLNIREEVE